MTPRNIIGIILCISVNIIILGGHFENNMATIMVYVAFRKRRLNARGQRGTTWWVRASESPTLTNWAVVVRNPWYGCIFTLGDWVHQVWRICTLPMSPVRTGPVWNKWVMDPKCLYWGMGFIYVVRVHSFHLIHWAILDLYGSTRLLRFPLRLGLGLIPIVSHISSITVPV